MTLTAIAGNGHSILYLLRGITREIDTTVGRIASGTRVRDASEGSSWTTAAALRHASGTLGAVNGTIDVARGLGGLSRVALDHIDNELVAIRSLVTQAGTPGASLGDLQSAIDHHKAVIRSSAAAASLGEDSWLDGIDLSAGGEWTTPVGRADRAGHLDLNVASLDLARVAMFANDGSGPKGAIDVVRSAGATSQSVDTLTLATGEVGADFDSITDASAFHMNGNAQVDQEELVLTTASDSQRGSAYVAEAVQLTADSSFSASFDFIISGGDGTNGADGLSFMIQSEGPSAIGTGGGGIGRSGVRNHLAVVFDTNTGSGNDRVAVIGGDSAGSSVGIASNVAGLNLNDGGTYTAFVDYDGTSNTLEVFLSNDGTKPAGALMTVSADLHQLVGSSDAYVGFTAATGGRKNRHAISQFAFQTDATPAAGGTILTPQGNPNVAELLEIIDGAIADVEAARTRVATHVDVLERLQEFNSAVAAIETAAVSHLVAADTDSERARLDALLARHKLAVEALAISNASTASILRLFEDD